MANQKNGNNALLTVDCENVECKKLSFTKIDNQNERSAGQGISYANYDYLPNVSRNFVFKTKGLRFTQYGIPQKNEKTAKFIKEDKDREYFRIPWDPSQDNCNALFSMLEKIDEHVEKCKTAIFGENANKYKYIKLVKEAAEADEDDGNANGKPKQERFRFCKVKFDTDFNDNRRIMTTVFLNENGKPELAENTNTVTDVAEYLTWNSMGRFVIMMNKLWAEKNAKKKGEPKEFGITLKCLQMEITERNQKTGSVKNAFRSYAFDNESVQTQPAQNQEQIETEGDEEVEYVEEEVEVEVEEEVEVEDDGEEQEEEVEVEGEEGEEGEEEEEQEAEPEPVPEPVKKPVGGKKAPAPVAAPAPVTVAAKAPAVKKPAVSRK